MQIHVAFHWQSPRDHVEGFLDAVVDMAQAPRSAGDVLALKTTLAERHELLPQYITLLGWTQMGD